MEIVEEWLSEKDLEKIIEILPKPTSARLEAEFKYHYRKGNLKNLFKEYNLDLESKLVNAFLGHQHPEIEVGINSKDDFLKLYKTLRETNYQIGKFRIHVSRIDWYFKDLKGDIRYEDGKLYILANGDYAKFLKMFRNILKSLDGKLYVSITIERPSW